MQRIIVLVLLWLIAVPVKTLAETAVSTLAEKRVARAQFTSAIRDREPVDQLAVVSAPTNTVFFFTDLRYMQGHTIIHRWYYKGQVMSQKTFEVAGPRWRVYSKKILEPGTYGEWSVTVSDETGWPWYVELFRYDPPH